jgi:2-keto-3-deoxy-L-rhamnonate aldolase RhmA
MRTNEVKRSLARGGTAVGVMAFEFATRNLLRLAAAGGAEFVILDQEHTGWNLETVGAVIAAGQASDVVPLVRVPATEYPMIAGALDAGAMGVMVPMVEDAEQAGRIVSSARYPPDGRRGFGILFEDEYEDGDVARTIERANSELLVIAQIETARSLEHVEAIAGVDGIDVLWVGHYDLSISIGVPAAFDDPAYLEAVDRVLAAAAASGKAAGIAVGGPEDALAKLDRGFRCIAYADLSLFERAVREGIAVTRRRTVRT